MKTIKVLAILLLGCVAVWAGFAASPAHTSLARETISEARGSQSPDALPDLVLSSFTLTPPRPKVSEPVTFSIHIRNDGAGDAPGWRVSLYIDPTDQPPTTTTTETNSVALFVTRPPGSDDLVEFSRYTFVTTGCQHVVYAWADPRQGITETDETNNMRAINLCVDPVQTSTPGADAYEPDDMCTASVPSITTDGAPQVRSFAPITDVDYVRLVATQGLTYTITVAGTGRDAEPNLELSDSCNFVPPFGTTTRLQFVAPSDGTYYLKLTNLKPNPDLDQTTYQLTARAEGQPLSGDQPVVHDIAPAFGRNDQNTNVTIAGDGFVFPTMAEICLYRNSACTANCTQLLNVTWVSPQKLYAVVPPNLNDLGAYCVQATNPGGWKGVLPNAFTMLPAQPDPREVMPAQSYSNLPTDLHLYGFNFADGISLTVGSIGLQNIKVVNGTHILATLPEGLVPGLYNLTARYGITTGQLANAFTVLPSAQDYQDLYAQDTEFWIDPSPPRASMPMSLSLVVHRISGTVPLANLPVRFAVNGETVGDVVIPQLAVDGQATTERVVYTPTVLGAYTVTATIDPGKTVTEAAHANNSVTRTVSVIEAGGDDLAPQPATFSIGDGKTQGVMEPVVKLFAEASDVGSGSTGVAQVRYVELEYNQGARLWVPVRDSHWLNYALNRSNYEWPLTPVGGVHYIQFWSKDAAGNVSRYPGQQRINYLPQTERVTSDQVRIYRQSLALGETMRITLTPTLGDADVYVWPPDWKASGRSWGSNQSGSAAEQVAFTAPVSGVYQVEVYGFTAAEFQMTIEAGVMAANANLSTPARAAAKHWPTSPIIDNYDVPPRDLPGRQFAYLPVVLRYSSSAMTGATR